MSTHHRPGPGLQELCKSGVSLSRSAQAWMVMMGRHKYQWVSKAAVGMSGRHKQMTGYTEMVMVMQYDRREQGPPVETEAVLKTYRC